MQLVFTHVLDLPHLQIEATEIAGTATRLCTMSLQIETIEILRAITHRLYMFKPTASTAPGDRNRRQCNSPLHMSSTSRLYRSRTMKSSVITPRLYTSFPHLQIEATEIFRATHRLYMCLS